MAVTVVELDPLAARLPTSAAARPFIDAQGVGYLAFDAAAAQTSYHPFSMPEGVTGTLTLKFWYRMASATSLKVDVNAALQAVTPLDAFDTDAGQSFDTDNALNGTTVPGTAGYIGTASITLTNADSYAAGDWCTLRFTRDATDATNDTATGDFHLVWLEIQK